MKNDTLINLNQVRKAKKREAERKQADENAVIYGLPKSERTKMQVDRMRTEAFLNGIQRERPNQDNEQD